MMTKDSKFRECWRVCGIGDIVTLSKLSHIPTISTAKSQVIWKLHKIEPTLRLVSGFRVQPTDGTDCPPQHH